MILADRQAVGRCTRRALFALVLAATGTLHLTGTPAAAQESEPLTAGPLAVQPSTAAIGTHNPPAGEYTLAALPSATVTVPPQCAGAHRCPLFIFLPGGGSSSSVITAWLRPAADRYGLILLAPDKGHYHRAELDGALTELLRNFAIDPDKIGIVGRCQSPGVPFAFANPHVFSRVAAVSSFGLPEDEELDDLKHKNKAVEFYIDAGIDEVVQAIGDVTRLRRAGYPVRFSITLRGHEHQAEAYDLLGRWFAESWAKPLGERTPPAGVELPLLTTDAVARLTTFWTRFAQEPDSIRITARRSYIHDVAAPLGDLQPVVPITDMTALAAQYPSVATDLKAAGLTGQQHDAYRLALVLALVVQEVRRMNAISGPDGDYSATIPVVPNSALAQNLAFVDAHPDELQTLAAAGVRESSDRINALFGCCSTPEQHQAVGPMGIWRTP